MKKWFRKGLHPEERAFGDRLEGSKASFCDNIEAEVTETMMDKRRKRLKFQAQHRGMKEMDLILGRFADLHLAEMSDSLLDQFEALLNCPDQKLYAWIIGREEIPEEFNNEIMGLLKNFEFAHESSG